MTDSQHEIGLGQRIAGFVRDLFPGYFAFVMATGIVASGLNAYGFSILAKGLYFVAAAGYLKLWILTIYRAVRFPSQLLADFSSFGKGPGFFTIIAATAVLGVLGNRLFETAGISFALFCVGAVLWVAFMYAFATIAIVSAEKPASDRAVNGSWLVIVVSTQSLSILSLALLNRIPIFVPAGLFMIGGATYILLISLVAARLLLSRIEAADLAPPYWIMMGAAAISCLAGVELDKHSAAWDLRVSALPVLQSFTLFFWIVATGWIPLLIILGVWRHGVRRVPLTYDPQLWSMVFPLGMYAFATHSAATEFSLTFIEPIATVFLPIACLAWLWTFAGMLLSGARLVFGKSEAAAVPEGIVA
ncbi:MAG: tellurite resistance/C4-dicarboxylate transporter family protein [Fimbriimonadales bacterium]